MQKLSQVSQGQTAEGFSAAIFHAQKVFVLLKDVYNFDIFYPGSITLQERKAEREYIACLFIRS